MTRRFRSAKARKWKGWVGITQPQRASACWVIVWCRRWMCCWDEVGRPAPRLYREPRVCEKEKVAFRSKIELMIESIRTFEPVAGTRTHVLLDSWYSAKAIWREARERGFLMTTGRKCNRRLRVEDPATPEGWRGLQLTDD